MRRLVILALLTLVALPASADAVVTFDNGTEGWVGPAGGGGTTVVIPTGGNPGAHWRTSFNNFGITFFTNSNAEFVGDYTAAASATIGVDIKVEDISFTGTPVSRPWLVDLRDYDNPPPGYPYVSVWFKYDDVSAASYGEWTHLEVTIADTQQTQLPPGWGGTGAEDPATFEPELPANRTFTDVLSKIDEIAFTTFEPGFVFGFTDHDMRLDNLSIAFSGTPVGPGESRTVLVGRAQATAGDLTLEWSPACLAGAQNYGIYEGALGDWYSHGRIDCSDAAADLTEDVTPSTADAYYLVVPLGSSSEGLYGTDSSGAPRPRGSSTCKQAQNVEPCP